MFRAVIMPGLELGLLEERHVPVVYAAVNAGRDHLRRWLPWVDATRTEDDTLAFIRASLEQFAGNAGFVAGIWSAGAFAGVIGTQKIDWLNRRVEVGYWLRESFQGRGIMTEVCRAVVNYLLTELDLNRVEIHCSTGNVKSAGIPRRLGFTLEATLRGRLMLNGQPEDALLFAMLKRDWKSSRA